MELLFAAVGLSLGIVSTMIAGRFIFMRLEKQKQTLENLLIEKETLLTNCKANIQEQEIALVRSLEKQNQLQRIEDQHRKISEEYQDLQVIYEKLKTEYQHFRQTKEELSEDFKQLTSELYEKRTKEFQQSNTQHLEQFLKPFKEQIKSFEEKVHGESKERAVLNQELKNLQNLNLQMRQDAINLTNALKGGNKTQGNWGEVVLERILEESGLSKGREYEIQASLKDETGKRYQPDVIVHLPDKKDIIIDSKVSLIAYERYISSEDKIEKDQAIIEHLRSINSHIDELSKKSYEDLVGVNSLDFVLIFMPVEGAFLSALEYDSSFFSKAFEKNIMVVSPSTLLVTLRTIENIWRYEHQNQNALQIAEKAGGLYDKFVGFIVDIEKIGKDLGRANESYDSALSKLSQGKGNLVSRVEGLKKLGVKTKKELSAAIEKEALGYDT